MIVWVLSDGDDYRTGQGTRVPADRITSYADVCDLHVCDYLDEAEARRDAESYGAADAVPWTAVPLELADARPEDFVEHFDD